MHMDLPLFQIPFLLTGFITFITTVTISSLMRLLRPLKSPVLVYFQSDILDVNTIFKDLGQMVYEQGEMIGKLTVMF